MSDERRLHDALSGLVPEPPPVADRAVAARGYARRARRGRLATVAGVALVAAAISLPFLLSGGPDRDGGRIPQPATSGPTAVVAGAFSCPNSKDPYGAFAGPDLLPEGAIAVRMCNLGGDSGFHWAPPSDALTSSVPQLVASVNSLPVAPQHDLCTSDGGSPWWLVFQYPDGHTQITRGESFGCGGVLVGKLVRGDRTTAGQPLTLFQQLLWEQRDASSPPAIDVPSPTCGTFDKSTWITHAGPWRFSAAGLCWRYETESDLPPKYAPLSTAQLTTVLDDLNRNRSDHEITEQECTRPDVIHYTIVGVNEWGDLQQLDGYCGAFDLSGSNSDIWRPNPASQAILDSLVAAQPLQIPEPSPDTSPDQLLSTWADMVNNGQSRSADQLWVNGAPATNGHVELKTEDLQTVDPARSSGASAYRLVRSVTALYREVPARDVWVDYHEREYILVRNSTEESWRILSFDDLGMVPTGR